MSEGDIWFINYGEMPPVVHCRLLGAQISGSLWCIITPDHDIYEEQLDNMNPDVVEVIPGLGGIGAPLPPTVDPNHVYGFRAMTAQQYQDLMNSARQYAAAIRVQMGIPPPGLAPAPAQAGPFQPAEPLVWVSMEEDHGRTIGEIICDVGTPLPAGAVVLGVSKALIPVGTGALYVKQVSKDKISSMEVRDVRVLKMQFDEEGQRKVDFGKAVARMTQDTDTMPGGGLMLDGPPSALPVLKGMVARGLTPVTDHEHWVRTHDSLKGDRSLYEMEVLTRALEAFATQDQINIPNSRGCELLVRRWQVIREAHRLNPTSPDYSASDIFMGWEYRRGDGVHTELAKFVAAELKDQAQIAKESRKAREEMAQKKNNKGGAERLTMWTGLSIGGVAELVWGQTEEDMLHSTNTELSGMWQMFCAENVSLEIDDDTEEHAKDELPEEVPSLRTVLRSDESMEIEDEVLTPQAGVEGPLPRPSSFCRLAGEFKARLSGFVFCAQGSQHGSDFPTFCILP